MSNRISVTFDALPQLPHANANAIDSDSATRNETPTPPTLAENRTNGVPQNANQG